MAPRVHAACTGPPRVFTVPSHMVRYVLAAFQLTRRYTARSMLVVKEQEQHAADALGAEVEQGQRQKPWQRYLQAELGLRDHWYPALFSRDLAEGGMRAATILGERLFFKRLNGTVYAVEDRCVHRGVPFSPRPECYTADTLTCWFHGFTYDWKTGKLVQILTEEDSALRGKVGIKSYPVFERNEVVFVFIGDGAPADPRLDIQPKFFDEDLVVEPLVRYRIRCNWRVAAENGFDAAHIYGHRNWFAINQLGRSLPLGTYSSSKDVVTVLEAEGQPKGIVKRDDIQVFASKVGGTEVRGANYPADAPAVTHGVRRQGGVGCYLPCGLQVDNFPRPGLIHFEWYVPIDEDNHMYTIVQAGYAKTPAEREAFRKESREVLGPTVWNEPGKQPEGFNNFDAFGRKWSHHAYAREDWWHRERLFKPDYIIMQWRMLVAKHARAIQTRSDWQRPEPEDQT